MSSNTPLYPMSIPPLRVAIGLTLTHIVRYVIEPKNNSAIDGHGATELHFGPEVLSIYPGKNEDYILIENKALDSRDYDSRYWSCYDLSAEAKFSKLIGSKLERVEIFGDEMADTGLCLIFEGNQKLWIYYNDTDLLFRYSPEVSDPIDEHRLTVS